MQGDHFKEDEAEGEDIGAGVKFFGGELFGGHILEFADDHARSGFGGFGAGFDDPEVDDLGDAGGIDEQVVRGDIAVDDLKGEALGVAEGVDVIESGGSVGDHPADGGDREGLVGLAAAGEKGVEVEAVDVLHR